MDPQKEDEGQHLFRYFHGEGFMFDDPNLH